MFDWIARRGPKFLNGAHNTPIRFVVQISFRTKSILSGARIDGCFPPSVAHGFHQIVSTRPVLSEALVARWFTCLRKCAADYPRRPACSTEVRGTYRLEVSSLVANFRVPAVYPTSANLRVLAILSARRISNLWNSNAVFSSIPTAPTCPID
jgi:hypothetical protein